MEEITLRKYIVNSKEYNSYEEIPEEYRKLISKDRIDELKNGFKMKSQILITPVLSEKYLAFKPFRWILFFIAQFISFIEGQSLRSITAALGVKDIGLIASLILSFFIGNITYLIANWYYKKQTSNLDIKGNIGFFKKFWVSQVASGYALVIYIIVYVALYFLF